MEETSVRFNVCTSSLEAEPEPSASTAPQPFWKAEAMKRATLEGTPQSSESSSLSWAQSRSSRVTLKNTHMCKTHLRYCLDVNILNLYLTVFYDRFISYSGYISGYSAMSESEREHLTYVLHSEKSLIKSTCLMYVRQQISFCVMASTSILTLNQKITILVD